MLEKQKQGRQHFSIISGNSTQISSFVYYVQRWESPLIPEMRMCELAGFYFITGLKALVIRLQFLQRHMLCCSWKTNLQYSGIMNFCPHPKGSSQPASVSAREDSSRNWGTFQNRFCKWAISISFFLATFIKAVCSSQENVHKPPAHPTFISLILFLSKSLGYREVSFCDALDVQWHFGKKIGFRELHLQRVLLVSCSWGSTYLVRQPQTY